jgi:hypothetical protein
MKGFFVTTMIGVLILICADIIHAQPRDIYHNQIEFMKVNSEKTNVNTLQKQSDFQGFNLLKKLKTSKRDLLRTAMAGVQKTDSSILEKWDTVSAAWIISYKYVYTYDAYGDKTSYIYYRWEGTTDKWVE